MKNSVNPIIKNETIFILCKIEIEFDSIGNSSILLLLVIAGIVALPDKSSISISKVLSNFLYDEGKETGEEVVVVDVEDEEIGEFEFEIEILPEELTLNIE